MNFCVVWWWCFSGEGCWCLVISALLRVQTERKMNSTFLLLFKHRTLNYDILFLIVALYKRSAYACIYVETEYASVKINTKVKGTFRS